MKGQYIVGIDEVGRGPLAGPVTVGAAAFFVQYQDEMDDILNGIKDSKKLSPKKRLWWCDKLVQSEHFIWGVSSVEPSVIDKIGITGALYTAVEKCLFKIAKDHSIEADDMLIKLDGSLRAPKQFKNQETVIKGDEKVPIIAAASIIAKVHRDRVMEKYHQTYPEYRFDLHKGYGTRLHCEHIRQHGLSDIHRKTFCKNVLHFVQKQH